jgi:hypothetical protein
LKNMKKNWFDLLYWARHFKRVLSINQAFSSIYMLECRLA